MESRYGGNIWALAEFSRSLPTVSIALVFIPEWSSCCCVKDIPGASLNVAKACVGLHWGWDIALHLAKSSFPQQYTDKEGGRSSLWEN